MLPQNDYVSPFSIDLSNVPASVTAGLEPITPYIVSTTDPWGPSGFVNTPPGGQQPDHAALAPGADHRRLQELPGRQLPAPLQPALAAQPAETPGMSPGRWPTRARGSTAPTSPPTPTPMRWASRCRAKTPTQAAITKGDVVLNSPTASAERPQDAHERRRHPRRDRQWINVKTYTPDDWGNTYQGLVNMLQPGDIIFINGSPGGHVTHAITWLGQFGVDSKGVYPHLIIDSTGITPQHVDSTAGSSPKGCRSGRSPTVTARRRIPGITPTSITCCGSSDPPSTTTGS